MIDEHIRRYANHLRKLRDLGPIPEDTWRVSYCKYCGEIFAARNPDDEYTQWKAHGDICEGGKEIDPPQQNDRKEE